MVSSSGDMIDFVGIPPLLRIALQVAMATMHFFIVQTGLCIGYPHLGQSVLRDTPVAYLHI